MKLWKKLRKKGSNKTLLENVTHIIQRHMKPTACKYITYTSISNSEVFYDEKESTFTAYTIASAECTDQQKATYLRLYSSNIYAVVMALLHNIVPIMILKNNDWYKQP